MYACLRRSDPDLLAIFKRPEDDTKNNKLRIEKSMKANSDIILAFGPSATDETCDIIDDDSKTAKEFWDELVRLETSTPTLIVLKLKQELDSLMFDENKDF